MNEMSPADFAAMNGNNNDGFGGNNAWWILLLFLFWGRGGYGGCGGGGGNGAPWATQADVRAAVDQQTLISKLDQQTYGLADATYALNNAITGGFSQAELSRCNQQAAIMAQLNMMAMNDQKCCCETQRAIERGFADTNYNLATQFCEVKNTIHNTTRDIIDNANGNTRAILDFLVQDKISTLQNENQSLKLAASQAAQNNYLISQLRDPCPVPAYVVPNPNCCYNSCGQAAGF
jgi:hypothetical protein